MRRIKIILAVVAAVATMLVLAAPAMAQDVDISPSDFGISNVGFCEFCVFTNLSGSGDFDVPGVFGFDNGDGDVTINSPGTIVGGNGGGFDSSGGSGVSGNGISFG